MMGMIKLCSNGSWWLRSTTDPRWDCDGHALVGSFAMPSECKEKIEELKKQFGDSPADLEWGYMKD